MPVLDNIKAAKTLSDVASLLHFTPAGLSYVLYQLDDASKYTTFDIPKKTGGTRQISAPIPQLKLLQKNLADLLYQAVADIQGTNPHYWMPSHGFVRGRTIISNANAHRKKRFVFNVDIEDFFGTINFGRVRGYFIKSARFQLEPRVATLFAQIACHENKLPQGAPSSPVISNFVGEILDARLVALAKRTHCTYTRYADDLTFSTNEKSFPTRVARQDEGGVWLPGSRLRSEVKRSGFALNPVKTRMLLSQSRQTVTGLVVNQKPNIDSDYYRHVRSMCHEVFKAGKYHRPLVGPDAEPELLDNLNPLEGMLSHIYFVKARRDREDRLNKLLEHKPGPGVVELYRKFLFFKNFVALDRPLIVTEGRTDVTYLKAAFRALANDFPELISEQDGTLKQAVRFLPTTDHCRHLLGIWHGTSGQTTMVAQYANWLRPYEYKPLAHPVIIMCDNDKGASNVFGAAAKRFSGQVTLDTTKPFYPLGRNLYLVKVPEGMAGEQRAMEDLFPAKLLAEKVDGLTFDPHRKRDDEGSYGKVVFAEKVIKPNIGSIDFGSFVPLLERLKGSIEDYKTKLSQQDQKQQAAS